MSQYKVPTYNMNKSVWRKMSWPNFLAPRSFAEKGFAEKLTENFFLKFSLLKKKIFGENTRKLFAAKIQENVFGENIYTMSSETRFL